MATHICGQCGLSTQKEQEYLEHKCSATGFKPTQQEHLGEEFAKVSEEAVKRGESRKKEELKFNVNKNKVSTVSVEEKAIAPEKAKSEEVKAPAPQVEEKGPFADLPEEGAAMDTIEL